MDPAKKKQMANLLLQHHRLTATKSVSPSAGFTITRPITIEQGYNQIVADDNNSDAFSQIVDASILGRLHRRFNDNILRPTIAFANPQPETRQGRIIQLLGIVFFASALAAGIFLQLGTDLDLAKAREQKSKNLIHSKNVAFEVYEIALLLGEEMEPAYDYNTGSYEVFLEHITPAMRAVDTKLIYTEQWPTDFSAIPTALRVNITSVNALRTALRAQRDLRKQAENGTSEDQVITFYATIMDNLAISSRIATLDSERFDGWRNFLSIVFVIQALMNLNKYALVGRKLVQQKRTFEVFSDPVFASLIQYWNRYVEFLDIAKVEAPLAADLMRNFTEQDAAKRLDKLHEKVEQQDFINIDFGEWEDVTRRHSENLEWALNVIRSEVAKSMAASAAEWDDTVVTSLVLLVIACVFALVDMPLHVIGAIRLQRQIIQYHEDMHVLKEAFVIVFDCIPKSLIETATLREMKPVKYFTDTCVMIFDISNIHMLTEHLNQDQLADVLGKFYQSIEQCIVRYNCFKLDVHCDTMALASGVGEQHSMDHVLEMLFAALELRDVVEEMNNNEFDDEDVSLNVRIGIASGSCYSRLVYLQVPRMAIIGEVAQTASVIHAACTPLNVLVASTVWLRLKESDQVAFTRRGFLEILNASGRTKAKVESYWASWPSEDQKHDGAGSFDGDNNEVLIYNLPQQIGHQKGAKKGKPHSRL